NRPTRLLVNLNTASRAPRPRATEPLDVVRSRGLGIPLRSDSPPPTARDRSPSGLPSANVTCSVSLSCLREGPRDPVGVSCAPYAAAGTALHACFADAR